MFATKVYVYDLLRVLNTYLANTKPIRKSIFLLWKPATGFQEKK
jgi:hypothetical protein